VWLFVIFEMAANKNGITPLEIQRKYGNANRTAWFMCHRVREAMIKRNTAKMLGVVVADETFIGGEPKSMHVKERAERPINGKWWDKMPAISLIDDAGEVRFRVGADVTAKTLRGVIAENVTQPILPMRPGEVERRSHDYAARRRSTRSRSR
jgi:hypothetical protein